MSRVVCNPLVSEELLCILLDRVSVRSEARRLTLGAQGGGMPACAATRTPHASGQRPGRWLSSCSSAFDTALADAAGTRQPDCARQGVQHPGRRHRHHAPVLWHRGAAIFRPPTLLLRCPGASCCFVGMPHSSALPPWAGMLTCRGGTTGAQFTKAVEAKQVAQQDAERARFVVLKADQARAQYPGLEDHVPACPTSSRGVRHADVWKPPHVLCDAGGRPEARWGSSAGLCCCF